LTDIEVPPLPAWLVREHGTDPGGRIGLATFDLAHCHRYNLRRVWDGPAPLRQMTVIGLNPSTAGATVNDQTVRRCCHFAAREGCNSLEMVNLFTLIATRPQDLAGEWDPVGGRFADDVIRHAVTGPAVAMVVMAWGNLPRTLAWRETQVKTILDVAGVVPVTFGYTRAGFPRHPCRLGNDARLLGAA
jgi:hypothetical protein